ncbi:preprotein translocase subunit SecE [Cytophagaceae bacterium ABcell3]|nr:preprotein translocase subunit SecE [Cytophagaceae bacterium ABcell3]
MNKILGFIRESIEEIKTKVSWPTYGELQNKSVVVLIASIIFALMIWAVDTVFENVMSFIY